jgi:Fe-Mn family superoxide dismutase
MKPYVLPDLTYDYSALEPHYSARVLELHHDKHHKAYVDGVNATLEKLASAREADDLSALVGLNLSGHVLHSLFWENLGPDRHGHPTGALAAAIDEHFGSFNAFRKQLSTAAASVQGSGWGALTWNPSANGSSSNRSTTTRATSDRAARRCW